MKETTEKKREIEKEEFVERTDEQYNFTITVGAVYWGIFCWVTKSRFQTNFAKLASNCWSVGAMTQRKIIVKLSFLALR